MTAPLPGALVGFGQVAARAHLPLWRDDPRVRLEAVVEPAAERARLARELLPGVPVFADLETLLASGPALDFVDVCSPPRCHGEQVLAACRHGLHVFCEKPLVTSLADLDRIRALAGPGGPTVFTVDNWRHAPLWAKVLELVGTGAVGTLERADLAVLRTPGSGGGATDWRRCAETAGGGILLDHGWHHLYLILALFGRPPRSVSAGMAYAEGAEPPLEETVDLALAFDRGEVARLHLTWRAPVRENLGTLSGSRGTLAIRDDHLVLEPRGADPTRFDFPEALSRGSQHPEWMVPVIEAFHREVRDPRARGENLRQADRCLRLIHLGYRSAREGSRPLAFADPDRDGATAADDAVVPVLSGAPVIDKAPGVR